MIIILTRAGLGLDLSGLKKIGRPAILMCFVPASFELLGMVLIAPKVMGLSILEATILGSVLAAVSPAVVVPRMVKIMDEGYGTNKGIPQLILAGASVDDVYVIVLFFNLYWNNARKRNFHIKFYKYSNINYSRNLYRTFYRIFTSILF